MSGVRLEIEKGTSYHIYIYILPELISPWANGQHFTEDMFKHIFLNENLCILIKISLKFVPKGPIDNKSALVQVMAWRRTGNKLLPEPMLPSSPMHICSTWGDKLMDKQWVVFRRYNWVYYKTQLSYTMTNASTRCRCNSILAVILKQTWSISLPVMSP